MRKVVLGLGVALVLAWSSAAWAAAVISVTPTSLDFGDVALGDSKELELTVQNTGDEALNVTNVTSTNAAFTPDVTALVIGAASSDVIEVTFRPSALGPATGTLTITSSDPVTPMLDVPLSGTSTSIEAEVDVDPDTLNTRSLGRYVTVYIELPAGLDPGTIDPTTVKLTYGSTELPALARPRPSVQDYDLDGVMELMVKFSRSSLSAVLAPGGTRNVELLVSGELNDGTEFSGTDEIRVLGRPVRQRNTPRGNAWGWWRIFGG